MKDGKVRQRGRLKRRDWDSLSYPLQSRLKKLMGLPRRTEWILRWDFLQSLSKQTARVG